MKRIAVLITVHNRKELTLICLEDLYQQKNINTFEIDIYLTDDGSSDGTYEAVRKLYPMVNIIKGDGSLYWNRGMLEAWREAAKCEYDFYLWLNNDTFLYEFTISRLIQSSTSHRDKSIIVGTTCAKNNQSKITYGGFFNNKLVTDISKENRCETFNGNIVLIPKYVYGILGTNDAYFHHCLGDIDYGLRANENKIEVWTAIGLMGECDNHERPVLWQDPNYPIGVRWSNFFSPLGNNPFEFFYFRRKHFGIIPAIKTFITNFFHLFFPGCMVRN